MKKILFILCLLLNVHANEASYNDIDSGSIKKLQKNTLFGSSKIIDLSSNGKFLVMGSLGGNIVIMDIEKNSLISLLKTTLNDITSIALSKDMTTIIAGDLKGQVEVWNLPKKTLVRKIDGHTQEITSVSISDDNSRIMTASKHEMTKLWNLKTGQLIITPISLELPIDYDPSAYLCTHLSGSNAFSFTHAQRWIDIFDAKSGKNKGKVTIFDETLDPNHRYITTHLPFINHRAIEFTADGKNVILSTMDEDTLCKDCEKGIEMCIKTFDISSNALKYKIPLRGFLPVLTLSKDGKHGVFIDQYIDRVNGKSKMIALLKRFEIDSGKIVDSHVLLDEWTRFGHTRQMDFKILREISEGKYLTLAQDGGIDIWDLTNLNITNKGK